MRLEILFAFYLSNFVLFRFVNTERHIGRSLRRAVQFRTIVAGYVYKPLRNNIRFDRNHNYSIGFVFVLANRVFSLLFSSAPPTHSLFIIHYSLFIIHYSLKKVALSDDFSRTLKTEQRECEDRRIGQALGLLVQPGTHVAMLTPVAYQPGSLPGTLLAYAMGNLILRLASCLDAFSVYPIRT